MKTPSPKSISSSFRGFSLLEMLIAIGSISTICGVGMVAVQKTRDAGQRVKLEAAVSTINQSVVIYLGNGGNLPTGAPATEILTRLKMKVAADDVTSIVGHTGPFLDSRVKGISISRKGPLRAVWEGRSRRFVVDTKGEGFSEFVLDDKLGVQPVQTERRQTAEKFAKRDSWVWDYDGLATAATAVSPGDADTTPDRPPVFTPDLAKINQPPECFKAQASPALLWPPNHKLVPIEITGIVDPENDPITVIVTSITQDEPTGDGDKAPDAVIKGEQQINLRAEREGGSDGRVYRIGFIANDGNGGSCEGSVRVRVPHSPNKPSVESKKAFDSFSAD